MKFKSDIEIQAGLKDKDGQTGSSGQILASTGSQVDWIDQDAIISAASKLVVIACKNTSGATITKGTPVYQTGTVGATDVIEVAEADSSDEDKMQAIGLLQTDIANNAFGNVVITGELLNFTTSPIDGVTPTTGDTIYVKPGGGLTLTKPTGVNFIQNVGLVGKVSGGNAGSLTVSSIMRSNDVPTPLYVDHTNQRLGIGITNPSEKLEVTGYVKATTGFKVCSYGLIYESSNNLNIKNSAYYNTIFHTNNAERMRITNAGNVGIGTTAPSEKLDVWGNIRLNRLFFETFWNDFEYASIYSSYCTSDSFFDLNKSNSTGGVSGTTRISTGNSYFNGNVGLGFTVPPYKLSTKVESNDTYAYYVANSLGSNRGGIYIDSNGHTRFLGRTGSGTTVQISASGTSYLNGGNVGIGTTSPAEKLHVNGEVRVDGNDGVATKKVRSSYFSSSQNLDLQSGSSADIILTSDI